MNSDARRALLNIYAELDAELAELQKSCRACGKCCDFRNHDNVLYASLMERQALGTAQVADPQARDEVCPYLHENRCGARPVRTLGCRTHFCTPEAGARGQELYEKYRTRIAEASRKYGIEWDYRPVLACLQEEGS